MPPAGPPPGGDPLAALMGGGNITEVEQPIEVRLKAGTSLHSKVVQKLRARLDLSYRNVSQRYDDWDRVDEHRRMFIDLSRVVRRGDKQTDRTKGREMPFDRSIVIPMSYAIESVVKTQLFSIFAGRDPFLELLGRGLEDIGPAKKMELLCQYDYQQSRGATSVYSMVQDAVAYGVGIIYDHWEDVSGWKTVPPPPPTMMQRFMPQLFPPPGPSKQWGTVKEFNKWTPVDPFNFWPDPRVSLANLQEGEFIGHRVYRGFMHILERAQNAGGPYFNLDNLKSGNATGSQGEQSRQIGRTRFALDQFALKENGDDKDKGYYTLDHLQVKLIPKDWEFGDSDKPEIWWFTLADERTVIRAHKSAYDHGEFSYSVAETNPDPHTIANPGVIENLDGLQRTANWLLNSHIENVRKTMNNEIVYDPDLIEEGDIMNPGPGRWIRLTQLGHELILNGRNIGEFYQQFNIADITGAQLKLIETLYDLGNRMSSATDQMQSTQSSDGTTLGEVKMLNAGANQRLGVMAGMMDAMAIAPLANRAVANRQQFTSIEQFVRIIGEQAQAESQGMERMPIGADDIQGNFDYVPHSPVSPQDPMRQASMWQNLLATLGAWPQLTAPGPDGKYLDVREIFNEAAKAMGARNIEQFYKQMQMQPQMGMGQPGMGMPPAQVVPDEQIQQAVQSGNMVPAG